MRIPSLVCALLLSAGCTMVVDHEDAAPGGVGAGSTSSGSSSGAAGQGAGGQGMGGRGTGGQEPSPGEVWFRESFDDPGSDGLYGFAYRYPESSETWQGEHRAAGGWGGSGGAHVRIAPCAGCDTSTNQFNIGWATSDLLALGKPTSAVGDHVYVRFRIRFDDDARWTVDSPFKHSAKFVLFGQTGSEPNSRVILHLFNPYEHGGCSPGFAYYDPRPRTEWVDPEDWGLGPIGWGDPSLAGHYAAFTAHVNISWDCAPGVLVTHGANPSPLPPQHAGAPPADGFYHLQFLLKSGDSDAEFRIWANNNDESNPSSRRAGFSLHTEGWDGGLIVGGYWAVGSGEPMGFVLDDVEIGDSFAPAWFPGP
jgi:hypothetical protein